MASAGVLAAALLSACGTPGPESDEVEPMDGIDAPSVITVTSSAFEDGGRVPSRFTCDGEGVSPPLAWSGVPADAAAVALVVDDPDAPSGTFTHWVVLDLPPGTTSLDEDATPPGAQARNSAGRAAWMGPCPPSGTHRYRFTVVALGGRTGLAAGTALKDALAAVRDGAVAQGRLTATYARSR
jgi:Raf kinase inhibitor-like YbhB/YbcL family protein